VVLLVAGGLAVLRFDLADRWLDDEPASRGPAAIPPPAGLDLPALPRPRPAAEPIAAGGGGHPAAAKVRRALTGLLADPDLGRHVVAEVAPLAGGAPLLRLGDGSAIPASTTKLVTTSAALLTLGPDATFETRVVSDGRRGITLVGGGDPYLASKPADPRDEPPYPHRADVTTLARATAAALRERGTRKVAVTYDDTLFGGPAVNPHWPADYVPDGVVSPITSLWVDEGRSPTGFGRVDDPALAAATVFAKALARAGIEVEGVPEPAAARPGAAEVASVSSAPLDQVVQRILDVSDNEAAEVLFRQVALADGGDGSAATARTAVRKALAGAGIDLHGSVLHDGSGLSRENRMDPRLLVDLLRAASSARLPELRPVVTGLPVAGFTGSLAERFAEGDPDGRGRVRAKTGTLTGVSGLAGIAQDLDGELLVFVLLADRVALEDTLDARDALDDAAAALGGCHCA
jgi:D-alanyl-D-alanine carboxypeptidase/D-alanyl-D-alanine-endopeptidase (penicillin-binding protein 4)